MSYNNNASKLVTDFIAEKIHSNYWKTGDKIWSENEFCAQLGVSRIAVRDAISSLVAVSVLKKVKGSGTYVNSPEQSSLEGIQFYQMGSRDVIDLMEFRMLLDPFCTELFIDRATEEEIDQLEKCYYNMISHKEDLKEYNYYSNEFHSIIAKCCKNLFIIKIVEFLRHNSMEHQNYLSKSMPKEKYQIGLRYHYKILQAIKAKDKEMAAAYCRYHIRLSIQMYQYVTDKASAPSDFHML